MSFNPDRRGERWRPWHPPAGSPDAEELRAAQLEAATVSPSALPPLTRAQIEALTAQRKREIQDTPCYRCGHKPAAPNADCPCCLAAHTPDGDGVFQMPEAPQ